MKKIRKFFFGPLLKNFRNGQYYVHKDARNGREAGFNFSPLRNPPEKKLKTVFSASMKLHRHRLFLISELRDIPSVRILENIPEIPFPAPPCFPEHSAFSVVFASGETPCRVHTALLEDRGEFPGRDAVYHLFSMSPTMLRARFCMSVCEEVVFDCPTSVTSGVAAERFRAACSRSMS